MMGDAEFMVAGVCIEKFTKLFIVLLSILVMVRMYDVCTNLFDDYAVEQ